MLQYEIYTHTNSSPAYSIVQANKEGTEMHYTKNYLSRESVMVFDENFIYNKTIEMARCRDTNLYFALLISGGMRISHILEANSTPELARELYEATNGRTDSTVLFINKISDGIMCLRSTDKYEPEPLDRSVTMKPMYNDPYLIAEVKSFMDLYRASIKGSYPEDGHRVLARDGMLQPWYPYGGLKGQKRRLLAEGARFISDYRVDRSSI